MDSHIQYSCTEQTVEEQQQGLHTAQIDSNCDLEKMLTFTWKEHWQSHHIHHITCLMQVSFHLQITIFVNNQLLWQNCSLLKTRMPTSGTERAAADQEECIHQRKLFFHEFRIILQGNFKGNVFTVKQLLSPITQHLSKTNPKETQECIPLRLKATEFISKWRIWQSRDATVNL